MHVNRNASESLDGWALGGHIAAPGDRAETGKTLIPIAPPPPFHSRATSFVVPGPER